MTVISQVHVVFKTHLDIGFTDLAGNVVRTYFSDFIPQALEAAKYTREHSPESRFIWTTGSWLLYEYLEQADSARRKILEDAILAGDIVWHAMPFTTHTELMDPSLFQYGLSLSTRLDARFGKTTIAGKLTDVPGHTQAMISYLAEAGIKFLHIGVNGASYVPEVPGEFVWTHPDGSDILVMYQPGSYGDTRVAKGCSEVLAFHHATDNQGPPNVKRIEAFFAKLHEQFPEATIAGSTLDAYANALLKIKTSLPIIDGEIGDTWIHGIGTDPRKVSHFLALSRWRARKLQSSPAVAANPAFDAFSRQLLLIPEHTWGRDWKKWKEVDRQWEAYVDEDYATPDFLKKLSEGYFAEYEQSYQEQRAYLDTALQMLDDEPAFQQEARDALRHTVPAFHQSEGFSPIDITDRTFTSTFFELAFDASSGAIIHLFQKDKKRAWASPQNPWNIICYEIFGSDDYARYWNEYIVNKEQTQGWSLPDFTKPGLEHTLKKGKRWSAQLVASAHRETERAHFFLLTYTFDDEAVSAYGCPAVFYVRIGCVKETPEMTLDLYWKEKQACRIPEALWFHIQPDILSQSLFLKKMNTWIHPSSVVKGGNRHLHAAPGGISYQDDTSRFQLTSLDAPLVAPGGPKLLHFDRELPDLSAGISFNLYNNIWGTNFPMWYNEDALFRFRADFS